MLSERKLKDITNLVIPCEVSDIHWRTQDSDADSLLFFKINEGKEQEFRDRIASTSYGWLIVNRTVGGMPANVSVIAENQWPVIQKKILDELYPLPKKMKFIGITGTNGKTTTTDLVLQLGVTFLKKGISVGTLGLRESGRQILDFGLTSPPLIDLRKYIHKYGQDKDYCVMEASSHALIQGRIEGIQFDAAGWLSFSQDHLDYHKSMEEYFKAKALIFNHLKPNARLFVPHEQKKLMSVLQKVSDQVRAANEILSELPLFFRTRFNQNNLEVAVAIMESVFGPQAKYEFAGLQAPDGRFYIRNYRSNYIVVDFAHTPDALDNICLGIKKAFPLHKLKVLFGCGGDRDRSKRPLMATVVDRYAEEIYITSDNPRNEDPAIIIQDILKGVKSKPFQAIVDRKTAVKKAFSEMKENEVLLLAGKGHEDYILINGVKHPYSDIREVDDFLSGKKA